MRTIRTGALALVATVAVLGAVTSSASAALPELGRCVPSPTKTGKYVGSQCLKLANGRGGYEWLAGPGAQPKFEGFTESEVPLETTGKKKVVCSAASFEGEYTGPKTETVTVDFIGCTYTATNQPCGTGPTKETEFESKLEGELGYIEGGAHPKVGWDLKPKSPSTNFAAFVCVQPPAVPPVVETPVVGTIEGSVIGRVLPIDKMNFEQKIAYKALKGVQSPQQFEGGAKDTLTSTLVIGTETFTEPMGMTGKRVDESKEPFEIKAK